MNSLRKSRIRHQPATTQSANNLFLAPRVCHTFSPLLLISARHIPCRIRQSLSFDHLTNHSSGSKAPDNPGQKGSTPEVTCFFDVSAHQPSFWAGERVTESESPNSTLPTIEPASKLDRPCSSRLSPKSTVLQ